MVSWHCATLTYCADACIANRAMETPGHSGQEGGMRASEPGPPKSTLRRGVPYTTTAAPLPLSCVVSARTSSDFCTVRPRLAGGAARCPRRPRHASGLGESDSLAITVIRVGDTYSCCRQRCELRQWFLVVSFSSSCCCLFFAFFFTYIHSSFGEQVDESAYHYTAPRRHPRPSPPAGRPPASPVIPRPPCDDVHPTQATGPAQPSHAARSARRRRR